METVQIKDLDVVKGLNYNVCMQCGECSGSCPVFPRTGFNVRRLVNELYYAVSPAKLYPPLNIYERKEVWDCTTCGTCSDRCPRDVKPLDIVKAVRSLLVEEGLVPPTLSEALKGVYKYGNPWGLSRRKRAEWAKDLKVAYASEVKEVDLLYFVGCAPSYDLRAQQVAKAVVNNLNTLGIQFAILGNEETCCGNEVHSLGEIGLFELLKEKNLAAFEKYGVKRVVTTSPHCYNAFKNLYGTQDILPQHYPQFFAELLDQGKLKFAKKVEKKVTFHDPCFLGRHNGIYEEPRKILENIPGVEFMEMWRSRTKSLCCEGGGGRMWYDVPGEAGRLAEDRVREAVELGAEVIAVACPFCLLTIDDAIKTTGYEEKIQVKDIMELVAEAL